MREKTEQQAARSIPCWVAAGDRPRWVEQRRIPVDTVQKKLTDYTV